MSVKRYWSYAGGDSSMQETETGNYVKHEDYAALEQKITDMAVQLANAESKCRELVAELSAVDKIHNEAVFITDDHYEQCPPEVQKMIRSLTVLQIPAYDAYLAEVRAQGVEMFANAQNKIADDEVVKGDVDLSLRYRGMSLAADTFAAQLRKGAAL